MKYQSESEEHFAYLNRWRRVRRNLWIALGLTMGAGMVWAVVATFLIYLRRWLLQH